MIPASLFLPSPVPRRAKRAYLLRTTATTVLWRRQQAQPGTQDERTPGDSNEGAGRGNKIKCMYVDLKNGGGKEAVWEGGNDSLWLPKRERERIFQVPSILFCIIYVWRCFRNFHARARGFQKKIEFKHRTYTSSRTFGLSNFA